MNPFNISRKHPDYLSIEKSLECNRHRVLFRLWVAKLFEQPYWLAAGVNESIIRGWLPMQAFRGALLGGDSADRRLRELREEGFPFVETLIGNSMKPYKRHVWQYGGRQYSANIYRLACDLSLQDWRQIIKNGGITWCCMKVRVFV